MPRRMLLLAPLLLFLGGCAVSAQGANDGVPQIGDQPTASKATDLTGDPVQLVRDRLERNSPSGVEKITSVTASEGAVTVILDQEVSTLSSAEMYRRLCEAAAVVVERADQPSSVKLVAFVQPDGRTIAAADASSAPGCFTP